jgi:OTU domain-containing protein 3
MGKKQKQQSKQESKDARKKDREIRRKHRQQQKADAFKRTPAYLKFFGDFDREMKETGLMLRDVVGDGNCLFRSVSDQVDGDESLHRIYRE